MLISAAVPLSIWGSIQCHAYSEATWLVEFGNYATSLQMSVRWLIGTSASRTSRSPHWHLASVSTSTHALSYSGCRWPIFLSNNWQRSAFVLVGLLEGFVSKVACLWYFVDSRPELRYTSARKVILFLRFCWNMLIWVFDKLRSTRPRSPACVSHRTLGSHWVCTFSRRWQNEKRLSATFNHLLLC